MIINKKRLALLSASLGLAIVATGIFSRPAETSTVYAYGFSNQGETCGGTCGPNNLCCKIVTDVD
jgi:hypothetical protein